MRPQFKSQSNGGNQKRRKPINEFISGKKRKVEEEMEHKLVVNESVMKQPHTSLSQKNARAEKGCGVCGQWFSSGHHCKGNCPNGPANKSK
jgi:hypothetical protein